MEVRLDDKLYVQAEEVVRRYPDLFKEGKKKPRQILQFKRIPRGDYVFGSCVKSVWRVSAETNNRAKLLITKEWLDQFVASHSTKDAAPETTSPPNRSDPAPTATMVKDAPPVLDLSNAEKFKDEKGNVLEIEVRGMRDEDGCFFRVKDVATCFYDIRIQDVILMDHTGFEKDHDYIYFYRPINVGTTDDTTAQQKKKELFLTYQGMLRYLFVSRNPNARAFRKWASRVLFAMQMGTAEQRESVASELLGVSVETVGKFMSACVRDIPMVYMLHLGNVPDSVHVEGDRNDFLLFKIGQHAKNETKCGFKGRCKGHQQEFREFRDEMSYLHFVFLDPMYVSEAERAIKDYFQEFRCGYKDKNEVYLIPKSKLASIKDFFRNLSIQYSGNAADVQREFDRFRNDTRARIHDVEVENRHLKETLELTRTQHHSLVEEMKIRIGELKERIVEQSATIRALISRMN